MISLEGVNAFRTTTEPGWAQSILNWTDASRYTLAQLLAARGEYQEAIDQLRAMHSFDRNTTANLMVSRLGSKLREAEVQAARRRVEATSAPKNARDKEEP